MEVNNNCWANLGYTMSLSPKPKPNQKPLYNKNEEAKDSLLLSAATRLDLEDFVLSEQPGSEREEVTCSYSVVEAKKMFVTQK